MATHVRTWIGARNARLTDMLHAGKRGKRCRVLCFQGSDAYYHEREAGSLAAHHTVQVMAYLNEITGIPAGSAVSHVADISFDDAVAHIRGMIEAAQVDGVSEDRMRLFDDEIRGVDAPRPLLHHVGDKWNASADESGIHLYDEADQYNLPAMITNGQTYARAYDVAKKAWPEVVAAKSFHDAGRVLEAHGAKLHYYCRMD